MQTIPYFTLTEEQSDLARTAFAGLDHLLFHPDSEQAKDLGWVVTDNRSPVPPDRAARIRETIHTAIGVLRSQTDPAHWVADGSDPKDLGDGTRGYIEGLTASRKVSLERAERLAVAINETAPAVSPSELNDTAALADLYYSGMSIEEVAEEIGAGIWEVRRAMRLAGIQTRKDLLADTVRLAAEVQADGVDTVADRYGIATDRIADAIGLPAGG